MPFDNDDLKEFKFPSYRVRLTVAKRQALLSRLEAAEAIVSMASHYTVLNPNKNPDAYLIAEAYDAWRKACGK